MLAFEKELEDALTTSIGVRAECSRLSILSSTYLCRSSSTAVVAKVYDVLSTLKWVVAVPLSRPAIAYRVSPYERLKTEIRYSRILEKHVRTFKAIGVARASGFYVLVRDYIEGEALTRRRDPEVWRILGGTLAEIHTLGVALGDANPGNFVASGDRIALVDLEQARAIERGLAAWDLLTLIIHGQVRGVSSKLLLDALEGYAENREAHAIARRDFLDVRVWTPYMMIAQPLTLFTLKLLKKAGYM